MNDLEKEIITTLSDTDENLDFEAIQSEEDSPLNQAVIEKDSAAANDKNWNVWKPEKESSLDQNLQAPINDAPEQEILEEKAEPDITEEPEPSFELPKEAAKQSANAILGMANNVLEVGGGFIITIKKHKNFYDFDDIVTLIDQQNNKNIQRIKLDKQDKTLLRPLIIAMLQEKTKTLSPKQQLVGAILSILLKKAQIVMQVRAENNILVERILNIIKEEKAEVVEKVKETDTTGQEKDQGTQQAEEPHSDEYLQEEFYNENPLGEGVLEVANTSDND